MSDLFFTAPRPLVFAHRGGAALAPENTMAAFDLAASLGVDGFELDVRLSKDGEVMVHHDRLLDRTTALSGPIEQGSASELVDANVPRLESVLERHPQMRVIVELKVNSIECADRVVDIVKSAGAERRVCLGGFGRRALRHVRRIAPEIATSAAREDVRWALYRSWCRWPIRRAPYQGYQVPEFAGSTRVVSPRFVADAHRAGLPVQVWTVNDVEHARRLLEWGVDALITDRPDVMVPLIRA